MSRIASFSAPWGKQYLVAFDLTLYGCTTGGVWGTKEMIMAANGIERRGKVKKKEKMEEKRRKKMR